MSYCPIYSWMHYYWSLGIGLGVNLWTYHCWMNVLSFAFCFLSGHLARVVCGSGNKWLIRCSIQSPLLVWACVSSGSSKNWHGFLGASTWESRVFLGFWVLAWPFQFFIPEQPPVGQWASAGVVAQDMDRRGKACCWGSLGSLWGSIECLQVRSFWILLWPLVY